MPNANVSFNGSTLIIPGAYYGDNVQPSAPTAQPTTPPLIFIGYGYGQKPQTSGQYTTPQALLSAIRGGPCSAFVPFLTNPSTQLNGAQIITYINPGENTQSSIVLDSGASGVVTATSTNYGSPSNLLQIMVQSGSLAGKKLTVYDGYSNTTAIGDNLGVPFQLAYVGATSGVTYTVSVSAGLATNFILQSSTSGESFTIPLTSGGYGTVAEVVEYINGTGHYSAIPISQTNGQLPSTSLDGIVSGSLPVSGASYTYENVTASLGDPVYWINQFGGGLATAAVSAGVTSSSGTTLNNIPLTSFTGAVSVPPTNSDYATAFNLALTLPGWVVFADSNSASVQALGTQHALTASQTLNGKWRRFFTGSSIGDSVSTTIANAQALNSISTTYAYPGIYAINTQTGQNQLYGGLYAAAAAAGMATGNFVNTPLTNKSLIGTGVEVTLTTSQINQLQQAGVMPVYVSPQTGVPTIVSDFTTWQNDANPENIFNQQVACRWFLAYALVSAASPFVGTVAAPADESAILNAEKSMLNSLTYSDSNPAGIISSWNPNSLILNYTGVNQTASIQVDVVLVGQNRFITILANILPLNLTVTNSTAT